MIFFSAIDFFYVAFIAALLVLSLFSICFILLLRFKSRSSRHLQNFNSLWTVRFLFVIFIILWSLTEVLRLPSFRRFYLYPLLPRLTLPQQANFCKFHLVLSLGFFEPGFLIILLFLLDVSVKKTTHKSFFSVFYVFASCLPLFLLQVYFVFLGGFKVRLPQPFHRSWFIPDMDHHNDALVFCDYPLLSTILFGLFGVIFILSFLLSCWKVVSQVINKALKLRIFALALTILVGLPLQVLLMGMSAFWRPDKPTYNRIAVTVFLITFTFAAVGEGILVIKPIADSLAAAVALVEQQPLRGNGQGDDESSSPPPPAEDGPAATKCDA
ncbi:hypothetical protein ERO13_A08G097800v2 [Gossypium hirsutum]|uniref:Uncharacterized protein n=5 Tax=Gossypium TaxID=3633 RepID=A0A1U8NAC5_GOSHI|nr:uncharacterized protein LOC107946219 [Gossypium hirsutum]KAB2069704.1 hypothetical protein ES319_A08G109800v1 [Gossypium barbadense]TYH05963.1 hypothetical protein ES288_A08G120500v1 [Gossypium darwinii]TYI14401.1 hypothetical protein ES332_A08G118600v1 [Gossypium tomentosum]TYJ22301.1 hypothetical protein E1A91_A08G116100v1 [Gossypium mustelinum]KAG4187447.1 hypothetical protein ERO13_A08G097800v2 [Gossypium hirsutum]